MSRYIEEFCMLKIFAKTKIRYQNVFLEDLKTNVDLCIKETIQMFYKKH